MIVVTGCSTVDYNSAAEPVLLTRDAGDSWEVIAAAVLMHAAAAAIPDHPIARI
jgi:hypothetical protein